MKKKIISRGLLGFPLGIAIGYVITILISGLNGFGSYTPCSTEFIQTMGGELRAVIAQAVMCGIMGTGFAAASVIWEIDDWSIAKQSGICFIIYFLFMMPIAYITNWMHHSFLGFLIYFGIFVIIFLFIWVFQYLLWKNKIKKINEQIKKAR